MLKWSNFFVFRVAWNWKSEHTVSTLLDELPATASEELERPSAHWIFPRRMIVPLVAAIVCPWLAAVILWHNVVSGNAKPSPVANIVGQASDASQAVSNTTPEAKANPKWTTGNKGPWGQLDTMPFTLEVPEGCSLGPPAPPMRWSFPGYSKAKVLAALRAAGIPEDEIKRLDDNGRWANKDGVVSVEPGDPLILGLTPQVRAKVYAILVEFPKNAEHLTPLCFPSKSVDLQIQGSGLAATSIDLFKRLLYPHGENTLVFADFEPALRSLPDDAERTRFMMATLRTRTVLARLRLDPDADLEKLSQYWGIGGRRRDILPLLSSLRRGHQIVDISILSLLPVFARERLYCHPCATATDSKVMQDCFWSAYNFFNNPTENDYNATHSNAGLNKGCYEIVSPNQLGDLMVLTAPDGTALHAAVFLADDIYFSKNGLNRIEPWILLHLADLLEDYAAVHPTSGLHIRYFRRKGF
jgi:hypothetical protein